MHALDRVLHSRHDAAGTPPQNSSTIFPGDFPFLRCRPFGEVPRIALKLRIGA